MKRILLALVLILALAGAAGAAEGGRPEIYTGTVQDEKGQPVAGATMDCFSYVSAEVMGTPKLWDAGSGQRAVFEGKPCSRSGRMVP
jgi:hypothetical protein